MVSQRIVRRTNKEARTRQRVAIVIRGHVDAVRPRCTGCQHRVPGYEVFGNILECPVRTETIEVRRNWRRHRCVPRICDRSDDHRPPAKTASGRKVGLNDFGIYLRGCVSRSSRGQRKGHPAREVLGIEDHSKSDLARGQNTWLYILTIARSNHRCT
jgi:hypothetical protein